MHKSIAWFVDNPVACNLLMWLMVGGGLLTLPTLYREELPEVEINSVEVSVAYPLATALEVEESLCLKLEQELAGIENTKKVRATAAEGSCHYLLELTDSADRSQALREVKNRVDRIDNFPEDAERPVVSEVSPSFAVMQVAIYADAGEDSLKLIGQRMERELRALDAISQVSLEYSRPYEISIEISEHKLRRHQLTMGQVAAAINRNSLSLPGGMLKGSDGQLLLRTEEQGYDHEDFSSLIVAAKPDGSRVRLSDIAVIRDGFRDDDIAARFDGKPAMILDVRRSGREDVIDVAEAVRNYMQATRDWLPDGVSYAIWQDESQDLIQRMAGLGNSAASGLLLIALTLALFMQIRLALWVTAGIPIALLGSVLLFPSLEVSISTMSVLAIMLVMGIVVDDAVVVGERIFAYRQRGMTPLEAAKLGTQEVSIPVIFGVLTTIATFMPLLFLPGMFASIGAPVGLVAITVLVFSLIESQWILPSHLRHAPPQRRPWAVARAWQQVVDSVSRGLDRCVGNYYRPLLRRAMEWRYSTLALALGLLFVTFAFVSSGRIQFQFFPAVPGERLFASVTLPEGVPLEDSRAVISQLESAAGRLREEIAALGGNAAGQPEIGHSLVSLGKQLIKSTTSGNKVVGSHFVEMALEFKAPEGYTGPSGGDWANRWRELTGTIPNALQQSFDANQISAGNPIEVQLRGDDLDDLDSAANELQEALYAIPGVIDIHDSFHSGKQEVLLTLLPLGHNLGLDSKDLALQVRQAFFGEEVQHVQRGNEEVAIYVRYPADERRNLGNLETMRIRTADGAAVPLHSVASIELARGVSKVERIDGERVVNVIANVDLGQITSGAVLAKLASEVLPDLTRRYPGIGVRFAGESEEQGSALQSLLVLCVLALFLVYALLAIPLRSHLQPLVVMSAIPFGILGSVYAHALAGEPLVFFSVLGMVALSGVVVNASLVLVDRANRLREDGAPLHEALVEAACERFRPIFLTSTTTFIGLLPLIGTTDLSTRMMFVPMALSLAGGVVFSTLVTLFLVPVLCLFADSLGRLPGPARHAPVQASAAPCGS